MLFRSARINRKYIDKHWLVFVIRGTIALIFGWIALFGGLNDLSPVLSIVSLALLFLGIVDAASALYNSTKKRGWINSVIDSAIDIITALAILFFMDKNIVIELVILSIYTLFSGVIDIIHGFISTLDPTDRFIRIITGICGCIMGFVILNAGSFEISTFIRFFGAYLLIVGVTSFIYGIHNRSQKIEDHLARKASARSAKKKSLKKSK